MFEPYFSSCWNSFQSVDSLQVRRSQRRYTLGHNLGIQGCRQPTFQPDMTSHMFHHPRDLDIRCIDGVPVNRKHVSYDVSKMECFLRGLRVKFK